MRSTVVRTGRFATVVAAVLGLTGVVVAQSAQGAPPGLSPVASTTTSMVRATALPTVQIDGVAWTQATFGNTVYVGGNFSTARPAGAAAGTNTVARSGLLAYTLNTGKLVTSFAPTLNGQVETLAISPNHKVLYVGGAFTVVNGESHPYIAAFDTATGALLRSFAPAMDNIVYAITASTSTVYVGGDFTRANGNSRYRLAAFRATSGSTLAWNPHANRTVNAMVLNPSGTHVIIGGKFDTLGGGAAYGLGAVDAVTGSNVGFAANQTVQAWGSGAGFTTLSTDGTAIYGGAYNFHGNGGFEGAFSADPDTGAINWVEDCHGDTYSVFSSGAAVYVAGHPHFCGNIGGYPTEPTDNPQRAVAFTTTATGTVAHNSVMGYGDFAGQPSPSLVNWLPDFTVGKASGSGQAAWSVTGSAKFISMVGEFPTVNGAPQQGIVRFAVPSASPDTEGPRLSGAAWEPQPSSAGRNAVRVAIAGNWDRDDLTLSYALIRDTGVGTPTSTIGTGPGITSLRWQEPSLSGTDNNAFQGTTYRYWITATDAKGNTAQSDIVSVTP